MSLLDARGIAVFSFSFPTLHSGKKTLSLPLEWDVSTSTLQVTLPEVTYPFLGVFGVTAGLPSIPENKNLGFSFGGFGFVSSSKSKKDDQKESEKMFDGFKVWRGWVSFG